MASDDWSAEENAAIVGDYLVMLEYELRGEPYNKREHNRGLQTLLRGRSPGAIEFKHANISAVMIELGFPYIDGYKPRANYQDDLRDEVTTQVAAARTVEEAAQRVVEAPAISASPPASLAEVFVPPPVRERVRARAYERPAPHARRGVDYLAMEARNRSLGAAGEAFALEVEHRRLWEAGRRDLAERIEHVSQTRGDGLGYDIHSYESDGRDRLVEVKTTAFGALTPFFASLREVAVSEARRTEFSLYRLFLFREAPKVFVLPGSLRDTCRLDVAQYRASPM
ncbi:MAG: DUF3883 domain-containing protein [Gemmatimonadaceae bacterium]